jgi:phage baseplate assembly protein V
MTNTLPRSRSTDRRYYGVVEALVTKVIDDPEGECRVTLRFPFFDGATAESDWCRVAQPYAGNGYGVVFVPEVGDEVLVAFVHGDMRFPVVIGGLYNGLDKPPTRRTAEQDQKMIRTKHGHQVVLDDSPGKEAIRITTAGGHELALDDAGGTVAVTGKGVKVTLDDSGTITVEGANVTVKGTGAVTVNAPEVTVTGTAGVTVEAAKVSLGSSAAAFSPVLGEEFVEIYNLHTHATVVGPSGPPIPPWTPPLALSQIVKVAG